MLFEYIANGQPTGETVKIEADSWARVDQSNNGEVDPVEVVFTRAGVEVHRDLVFAPARTIIRL